MSSTAGPERPKCVNNMESVNETMCLPVPETTRTSAFSVRPLSVRTQWCASQTSGTSEGMTCCVTVCPKHFASSKPRPSEPDLGKLLPPLHSATVRARKAPQEPATSNPPCGSGVIVCTRMGLRISTPASCAACSSAFRTVCASSVVGNNFPVSSCFNSTPS